MTTPDIKMNKMNEADNTPVGGTPVKTGRAARVIWLAYHDDLSDFAFFGRKIDALSHAVDHGMKCKPVESGKSIREQIQ